MMMRCSVCWQFNLLAVAILHCHRATNAESEPKQRPLPRQQIRSVSGIPGIREYWEFLPEWAKPPSERPVVVSLHGNAFKVRDNPRAIVTSEYGAARLFATPEDFDPNAPENLRSPGM